jgi:hypothetical protein
MFTLHKNRIESDQGFTITFDRSEFVYETKGRRLRLNHEMLPTPKAVAIWSNSVAEMNPTLHLTSEERDEVIQHIEQALRAVGYDVTLI